MTKFDEKFFDVCSENFEPVSESMTTALNSGITQGIVSYIKENPRGRLNLPCGTFEMTGDDESVIDFKARKEFISGLEKNGSIDPFFMDEGSIISDNADLIKRITKEIRGKDGNSSVIAFAVTDSEVAFLLNLWSEALRKTLSFGAKSGKVYEVDIPYLGVFSIVMDGDDVKTLSFSADKTLKQSIKNDAAYN